MKNLKKRHQQKLPEEAIPREPRSGQQTLSLKDAIDLAVQHHNGGQLAQAKSIYQQILHANPNHPVALHLLGVIAHQGGNNDEAVSLIKKAIDIKPDYPDAYNNLGVTLQDQGKLDEAVATYRKAIAFNPDYAEAYNNLGFSLWNQGLRDEAMENYHKALALKPDYADVHNNLGIALQAQGDLDEAMAFYRKAIALKPDYAKAYSNLGFALQESAKTEDAFACHRRAIAINPEYDEFWSGFANALEYVSFTSIDNNIYHELLLLLDRSTVRPAYVFRSILSALRCHPQFSQILVRPRFGKPAFKMAYGDTAELLSSIPLFLQILRLTPVIDLEIEWMLTLLRRALLKEVVSGNTNKKRLPFLTALAHQCFINEYVFHETDDEASDVKKLEQQIAKMVKKGRNISSSCVVMLGAYKALYHFPWARDLSEHMCVDDIKDVLRQQISEPQEEQSLRSQISCLNTIHNTVSLAVREQYEENPYPRWVKTGIPATSRPINAVLQSAPFNLDLGDAKAPESLEILVAGCGTGQHSIVTASSFSNTNMLAVDLSLSSLSYALRKSRELGITNIEYAHADIMELDSLERRFDLIESVGVLHHLDNPLVGWKVLADLLNPGGLMKIGLYSETARQHIVSGRTLIANKGYTTSLQDIRRCRLDIVKMAESGNQAMTKICNGTDFFTLSHVRDLLFHVQEHRFTLPQLEEALKALNLKFLGFEMRERNSMREFKAFSRKKKNALTSLSQWHKFELQNPNTFVGMYQFWCQKV